MLSQLGDTDPDCAEELEDLIEDLSLSMRSV